MAKENTLEIKVLAKNLAKEAMDQARKDLQELGEAAKKSGEKGKEAKGGFESLNNAFKSFVTAAVVKQLAQAALELGKLGVQAAAVEQRFYAFAGGSREAETVLKAVMAATDGTIDRMGAMQSATKLMQMGLASNADEAARLINMAARLGDQTLSTSERVDDFAAMLANQSIPRLDNYGMSSGKVRARIDELMASTEGMTREQAFLQATLEEGAIAMEKLGDAGLGQLQNLDRLSSAWKDFKVTIGNIVAPALTDGAELLTKNVRTLDQLAQIVRFARQEYGFFNGTLQALFSVLGINTEMMKDAELNNAAVAAGTLALTQGYSDIGMAARQTATDVGAATEAVITNYGSIEFVAEASKKAYSDLQAAIAGALGKEIADFNKQQEETRAKADEIREAMERIKAAGPLTKAKKAELAELVEELDKVNAAVEENAAKHEEATRRIIFGFMEQRLAMDGLTQAELMALQEVAFNWGLVDTATYTAMMGIDNVATSFENGKIKAEDLGKALLFATDSMVNMPTEHTFTFNWNQTGTPPPNVLLEPSPGFDIPNMYASGGVQQQSGWAMVGEQGPELTWLPRGAQVFSAPETERMLQNGGVGGTVNAPVTVYANVAGNVDIDLLARRVSEEIGRRVANRRVS
ncbi:MAG TPA: hypothetical protein PKH77_18190 [Anaerolineae bacterium]|nr:hypothetical protein [Anaerolineae bacterium]